MEGLWKLAQNTKDLYLNFSEVWGQ